MAQRGQDLVSSQLWLGFDPWPRNFRTLRVRPKKKKKKKTGGRSVFGIFLSYHHRVPSNPFSMIMF